MSCRVKNAPDDKNGSRRNGGRARAKRALTYRDAGVSLDAADSMEDAIGPLVRRTYGPRVMASHGGFAGLFRLDYDERLFAHNYRDPVLVACTDGVGSKILVALAARRFDTVGIDLVAMSVNDLLCCGAEPLLFLDYIALHKLDPRFVVELLKGVTAGCEQAGCALLGGETAEMPDLYRRNHFDIAGFAVGVVERSRIIGQQDARPGDILIGLPSSGLHSNGYALARRVLLKDNALLLNEHVRALGEPLVDALLRPTMIYVRPVLTVLRTYRSKPLVTGMAHITGSGLPGNVPRFLPSDCDAVIQRGAWSVPPIYGLLEHLGVAEDELYRVFNMGIGFVLAVRPRAAAAVERRLVREKQPAMVIGRIKRGRGNVEIA